MRHVRDTLQQRVLGRSHFGWERLCERMAAEDHQLLGGRDHPPTQLGFSVAPMAPARHRRSKHETSPSQPGFRHVLADSPAGCRRMHVPDRAARGCRRHPKTRTGPCLAKALPAWPAKLGAAQAQAGQPSRSPPVPLLRLVRRIARRGQKSAAHTAAAERLEGNMGMKRWTMIICCICKECRAMSHLEGGEEKKEAKKLEPNDFALCEPKSR